MSRIGKGVWAIALVGILNYAPSLIASHNGATSSATISPAGTGEAQSSHADCDNNCKPCYKTVKCTVMKPVTETCYRTECVTEYKKCYQTVYTTVKEQVCKPVNRIYYKDVCETQMKPTYKTCYREERYTVCRKVPCTTWQEKCVTVCKPVWEKQCVTVKDQICNKICETHYRECCEKVKVPVKCTVQKCVTCTEHKPVKVQGCKHVCVTMYKDETATGYKFCKEPIWKKMAYTTYEKKKCGEWVTEKCVVPGKKEKVIHQYRKVCSDPCCDPCNPCGSCSEHAGRWKTCKTEICEGPCEVKCKKVWKEHTYCVPKVCEKWVKSIVHKKVPYTYCKKVPYTVIKKIPTCEIKMVPYTVKKTVPVTVCKMEERTVTRRVPYTVNRTCRGAYVDGNGVGHARPGKGRVFKCGAYFERTETCRVKKMCSEVVRKKVPVTTYKMVNKDCVRKVPYTVCNMVPCKVTKKVPVTVCEKKMVTICKKVPHQVCKTVPVTVHKKVPYTVTKWVPCTVTKQVPVSACCESDPCCKSNPCCDSKPCCEPNCGGCDKCCKPACEPCCKVKKHCWVERRVIRKPYCANPIQRVWNRLFGGCGH